MFEHITKTKRWQELTNNLNFQRGNELFREKHNLSVKYPEARKLNQQEGKKLKDMECFQSKKYSWYKKVASGEEWNKKYSHSGYTILAMNYKEIGKAKKLESVEFAFLSVIPSKDCLEITNIDELLKIQRHRELAHYYPQPMEVKQ